MEDRATASNLNSAPKCTYFAYNGQDAAASCSDVNAASTSNRFDSEAKTSLIRALSRDSKAELAAQTKRLFGELDRATASKLLHLCCNFDSAECASAILGGDLGAVPLLNECDDSGKSPLHTAATAHSSRCVEVLLKKHSRTDLRTKDGQAQLALELSLADTRIDLKTWNPKGDFILLTEKSQHILHECLIREALALGGRATPPLRAAKRASTSTEGENSERKKLLLREIELLQLFGAVAQKVTSPLIRAAQGGDETVIQLLLKTNLDVNDTDAEGNTVLHWILKQPRLLCPQQIKILSLLLDHGARVSQRNRLGLTAFHIAAGNGNSEALEVLLLEDPVGVQYKTEMKETPLFFAVKNESKECAELLLTWGANSEVLNLRRQRAIDLATSQDMRYTLLNPTTVSLINHAFPNQHKCTALVLTDEDTATTTERNVNSSAKADVCKYFDSHQGCVRGANCFYAQCEESRKVKEGVDQSYSFATKLLKHKVFVGGLPPSVDSDDLGKFCEEEFGSVEDAIVIVTQIDNKIQSRGFGFVTFRQEKSASEAMRAHYVTMRGKTVEIKSLIPKLALGAEFEKMSPQRDQEQKFQLLQRKSNENNQNIMEGDNPELGSWADRLVHGQPTVCSTEPQVTKSSVEDVKGTTCIAWALKDSVIYGTDSRCTYPVTKALAADTYSKIRIMTPRIVAMIAGSNYEASKTCDHMKSKMSEEILNGTDKNSFQKLTELGKERDLSNKERNVSILVCGMQDKVATLYYLFISKSLKGVYKVPENVRVGSGENYIGSILDDMWKQYGDNTQQEIIVDVVCYILLLAALRDPNTGGLICVQTVDEKGIESVICETVLELMIRFYELQLSVDESDGVDKAELPLSFQLLEKETVFLFYSRGLAKEVQTWLRSGEEKIKEDEFGHILTELQGQFHAHRVEFQSSKARDKFFKKAKPLRKKKATPFSSTRDYFRYYELNKDGNKHPVFVAPQTLDMLKSLILTKDMKNRRLVACGVLE